MSRSRAILYLAILGFFFLETALFNRLRIFGTKPELLLVATIFFGFYFGRFRGMEVGAVAGLLKDVFTIGAFGVNAFLFLTAGFIAGAIKDKVFKETFIMQFFFSFLAALFFSSIFFLHLGKAAGYPVDQDLWLAGIYKALYTGFLGPAVFSILSKTFTQANT